MSLRYHMTFRPLFCLFFELPLQTIFTIITYIFSVCGNDIVIRNATLTAEVALIDEFFNDANAAQSDLMKEVGYGLSHTFGTSMNREY